MGFVLTVTTLQSALPPLPTGFAFVGNGSHAPTTHAKGIRCVMRCCLRHLPVCLVLHDVAWSERFTVGSIPLAKPIAMLLEDVSIIRLHG